MRTFVAILIFSFIHFSVAAQHLMINQEAGKFYIQHEVLAKQNWYTIGRMYNISPKEIAPFNNTSIDKLLSIGQELKIPLLENNFVQIGQPADNEVFVPLYHMVKEKEGLFRISSQYNKVDQKSLKAWNGLKSAELGKGKEIVVGFLRIKKNISPLASSGLTSIPDQINGKSEQALVKADQLNSKSDQALIKTDQDKGKTGQVINKSETPMAKTESVAQTKNQNASLTKTDDQTRKKDSIKLPGSTAVNPSSASSITDVQAAPGTEGVFAATFDEQTRNGRTNSISGNASMFRSTSGWKDGKYYVLMNSIAPGTIVKVMSVGNGRVIYAKVLSDLPPIKENEGLLIRISNAAAAQLMMNESRFEISVHY
ncbi:MAG: LysM peptidoglycan-binding domain-containing protein [Chitinophagaceae bacterium]